MSQASRYLVRGVQEKVVVLVDIAFAVTTVVLIVIGVQKLLK